MRSPSSLLPDTLRPVATYRLQLRDAMSFAQAEERLPALAAMGISHLYLSPIQQAVAGSTHGYDVTDPTRIEPSLGGREGFSRLSQAARAHGMGIILDIVPNHTAFSLENPWLSDVLRHGEASRWAPHFDIDWSRGPLVLPFLATPFEVMLEGGNARAADAEGGPVLLVDDMAIPLAPGALTESERAGDADALRALHARQSWRLTHWELERDGVTHRRFFNVTGLIGMRVEDPAVFDDTHALILELVRSGEVQGLRVDHVDGLAEPGAYLARLRAAVGDLPVWIEKILMADEVLAPWPVEGTSGYESGAAIARVLADPVGLARLDAIWCLETDEARSWAEVLVEAKGQVIRQDLAAELHQLRILAAACAEASPEIEAGEETLREAILALLVAMPRYRTYLEERRPDDLLLLDAVAEAASTNLLSDAATKFLAHAMGDGDTHEARALRQRFQQVTGALMAKAQEDTAFFRFTRCLAQCEVGADPGDPTWTPAQFGEWLETRSGWDLTLTSSHDTKRAEDARMRLLAMTHRPEAFLAAYRAAASVPGADAVPASLRWSIVQSLLALWEEGRDDLAPRLAAYVEKALREAREVTTWAFPRPEAEAFAEDFARSLAQDWQAGLPEAMTGLVAVAEHLSLAQVALKMVMPGIPDLYQGAEAPLHHLTDPDNRLAVDWNRTLPPADEDQSFAARKNRLTRRLLGFRRDHAGFFATAGTRVEGEGNAWTLVREGSEGRLELRLTSGGSPGGGSLWSSGGETNESAGGLLIDWAPSTSATLAEPQAAE